MKHTILYIVLAACAATLQAQVQDPLTAHIDRSVRPQDDFFAYANGAWLKANPIPPDKREVGIFTLVQDTIDAQLRSICEACARVHSPLGTPRQKIGDLYASGLDTLNRERSLDDLREIMVRFDRMGDTDELQKLTAYAHTYSSAPLFNLYVAQDEKQSDAYALYLTQGGLSMPDRRYYVDDDGDARRVRTAFLAFAKDIFTLAGDAPDVAAQKAEGVLDTETRLARISRPREALRDPHANYNKLSLAELQNIFPAFYMPHFLRTMQAGPTDSIIVGQPEYFAQLNAMLVRDVTFDHWRDYLKFHFLRGIAPYLSQAFRTAHFNFYARTLRGIEQPEPLWKTVVGEVDEALGDLVGQVYVQDYLPAGTKEKFTEIGSAVKAQLAERIKGLAWMGDKTKEKALAKLEAVKMKLAYPDQWRDLARLNVNRRSYVHNMMNASRWQTYYNMGKLGQPVNRDEWLMQPQTYNAYYDPVNNEICIPGCNIFIPGFEGRMADDAVLYALIGGTFGHELTHGFDDQGSQYDAHGNLRDWWTKKDRKQFEQRTQQIVKQFDGYYVTDSLHINGTITQGENIADLGGLIIALRAYQQTAQYKAGKAVEGFTPLQRFFLGYAAAWMMAQRAEAVVSQVKSNEHAPARWRVIGPLSNLPEFYEAFDVKTGDKMWRSETERVAIW